MAGKILWRAEDVLRSVHGRCLHEQSWSASGVSIDSRTIKPGDLFIAIVGPEQDGHDHVASAFANGAAAALVSRQPSQVPPDAPLIMVDDTFAALHLLGKAGRARAKGKIIAVTGSVGKTSTKEMLRLALGAVGETYANPGSLNNHWGAPLSLANLPPDAAYGVFELGMNHVGELSALAKLAQPHVALVTAIEAVHLEFFASTEAIADAKAEIFEGLVEGGIAILNRDSPHYARLAASAKACGIKKILSFGADGKSDARMADCAETHEGSAVHAVILGQEIHYRVGAPGIHLAQNSLGALLAAASLGADIPACASALTHYIPPKGRGVKHIITLEEGGSLTVIDESYNASPASVKASIRVLAHMVPGHGGRRILVLGDMRELGPTAPALHSDLAPAIIEAKIDRVFSCGEMMKYLHDALPASLLGAHAASSAELAPLVAQEAHAGDVITAKGSHSMKLELVVEALRARDAAQHRKIAS
ncbi:MAG: UDP-N-acetylmuramoylalanyl-D-glutamyl-2,6-diaminopimelate--D-alanyl-D-alanine ligase [Alphaproteobacteria bacterium]|nr:UDP-N-acetylmuramoylalanyl-D-glutamyl-2,6-diaminopimelate--D-alanyl-D-alanine ligase [Alphaproteobacteria bacterium]